MTKRTVLFLILLAFVALAGCQSASQKANQQADQAMYQPVTYANASKPGPQVVVIPGAVKSMNATFAQKYGPNNIADFAELELGRDNFQVLERQDLGSMLQEIEVAANLGDAQTLQKFKRGRFQATNWLIRFDVLRAEPVANVQKSFDGSYLGGVIGGIVGHTTGSAGLGIASGAGTASIKSEDAAGVWIVGMRYKVFDANTGEQKATGYFEDKMEMGTRGGAVLGVSEKTTSGVTLDTLVQRLIQMCVSDLDKMK
ncbi:hypothetical protein JCM15519_29190 [Fundidesulfovibrio butyratiphilus]